MILMMLVVFVFPRQFCNIFLSSEDAIIMAISYLSIVGISYILMPARQLLYGFIVGTGHTKVVLFSAIVASIVEVSTILVLKNKNIGVLVILGIAILCYVLVEILLNLIYYFSKKWQKQVIKQK